MTIKTDKGLTVDDLPRLSDEDRQAVDDGYTAMAGVPIGDEPVSHTPGPWTTGKGNCHVVRVDKLNGMKIAECNNSRECDSRESFANARLMAASPELLAALRSLVETVDAYTTADGRALQETALMSRARAIVAKVEGRS